MAKAKQPEEDTKVPMQDQAAKLTEALKAVKVQCTRDFQRKVLKQTGLTLTSPWKQLTWVELLTRFKKASLTHLNISQ